MKSGETRLLVRKNSVTNDELQFTKWRHKKRGSEYTILGVAEMQCSTDPKFDHMPVIIYMGDDNQVWVRLKDEFMDGRFEAINEV